MNFNRSPVPISIALVAVSFSLQGVGAEEFAFPPHTFTLLDGYELELAAAPPLVERAIHMYFDEEGALYVTDSSGTADLLRFSSRSLAIVFCVSSIRTMMESSMNR